MADLITGSRMILSFLMIFLPVGSSSFTCSYLLAGFSDMIDGRIARKYQTASEAGARFDSIADLIFVAVSFYKLLPAFHISALFLIWAAGIAMIKVINGIWGYAVRKRFASVHTTASKLTGFLLFLLPLTASVIDIRYSVTVTGLFATFAAIQEGHCMKTGQ